MASATVLAMLKYLNYRKTGRIFICLGTASVNELDICGIVATVILIGVDFVGLKKDNFSTYQIKKGKILATYKRSTG